MSHRTDADRVNEPVSDRVGESAIDITSVLAWKLRDAPSTPSFAVVPVTETVPPFLESVVPAQLTSFSELYIAVSMSKCSTSLASVS